MSRESQVGWDRIQRRLTDILNPGSAIGLGKSPDFAETQCPHV